jgi:hypothetical protein
MEKYKPSNSDSLIIYPISSSSISKDINIIKKKEDPSKSCQNSLIQKK